MNSRIGLTLLAAVVLLVLLFGVTFMGAPEPPLELDTVLEITITDPESDNFGREFVCEFHNNGNMICVEQ